MARRLALLLVLLVTSGLLAAQQLAAPAAPPAPAVPPATPPPPDEETEAPPAVTPTPGATLPSMQATLSVAGRDVAFAILAAPAGPLFLLPPLAPLLGGELRPGPAGVSWVLRTGDLEAVLASGSAVTTFGPAIVQLSQPVVGSGAGPWVPLDLLRKSFGEALHWDLQWDAGARRLVATPQQRQVVPVEWSLVHLQGMSTLVLQFAGVPRLQVKEQAAQGGQQVEVALLGDQVASPTHPPEIADPLVQGLRFAGDKIILQVAPGAVVEHYQQQDPFRLVFDVYQRVAAAPGAPTSEGPRRPTIVIDPGHGGVETGAIGPGGTQEKELTLLLAQALGRELQRRLAVDVELTRDEDALLPLDTRAAIANQHRAALFISIHINSSVGANAHGAETYFLSLEASDAKAAAAARAENLLSAATPAPADGAAAPAAQPATADLNLILWDLAQSQ
ncbi:MAG TPA: N-acetylmuramoyl-L-alanine amidase, partial [Thermoanaerobaculia bacterium]|nr:N-acetylmuramoyl-L-alanine amidase [Thermoanaerobaculia bacterium]